MPPYVYLQLLCAFHWQPCGSPPRFWTRIQRGHWCEHRIGTRRSTHSRSNLRINGWEEGCDRNMEIRSVSNFRRRKFVENLVLVCREERWKCLHAKCNNWRNKNFSQFLTFRIRNWKKKKERKIRIWIMYNEIYQNCHSYRLRNQHFYKLFLSHIADSILLII